MLGSLAASAFYSGIRNAVAALASFAIHSHPLSKLGAGAGLALWGLCSVLGFLGFWLWVFAPAAIYGGRMRPLLITTTSLGVIALILFFLMFGGGALSLFYMALGILSMISGIYIFFDLTRKGNLHKTPEQSDLNCNQHPLSALLREPLTVTQSSVRTASPSAGIALSIWASER